MIRRTFHLASLAALFCGAAAAVEQSLPELRIGETSRVEVIAPFSIVALDRDKTAELKLKEAQKIPAVFRFYTNVAGRITAAFHEGIAVEHERFQGAVSSALRKAKIDSRTANGQQFGKFVKSYQGTNATFQIPLALARTWATNGDDTDFIKAVEEHLHTNALRYIRPDDIPQECSAGWQIRLITVEATNTPAIATVEKAKLTIRRGELLALGKLRSEFAKPFSQEQKPLARFAASLLAPNCFPEQDLTREWRARRVQDIWSVTRFEPGETIVRSGEVVTATTKAALDEMRVRLLAAQAQNPKNRAPLVIGSAISVVVLFGALLIWVSRRRRSTTMALQLAEPALANADPIIRAQVADRLARLLGHTLVQKLFADRIHLLEAQTDTTRQTRVIEERIETIQAQVAERYRDYEKRIAELEAELVAAAEENRDLIRAKIFLAKQEMSELARNRLTLN